ncbi:hypothetical protein G3A39_38895 [Paraburkholderia aspalathi]|nr:hypothetical protein [Paraburkholderia aspalathi]
MSIKSALIALTIGLSGLLLSGCMYDTGPYGRYDGFYGDYYNGYYDNFYGGGPHFRGFDYGRYGGHYGGGRFLDHHGSSRSHR